MVTALALNKADLEEKRKVEAEVSVMNLLEFGLLCLFGVIVLFGWMNSWVLICLGLILKPLAC